MKLNTSPSKINIKKICPSHILFKLQKTSNKEKILEKSSDTHTEGNNDSTPTARKTILSKKTMN
jgi:hypothetical protein